MLKKHPVLCAYAMYSVIFALYFLSYPLNHALVSNQDSIYYLAVFNHFQNVIAGLFTGQESGQFFYPDSYPSLNGEPSFGIFPFWALFKLIFKNDILVYYLLIVLIFALNSTSLFKLIRFFNQKASFLVALITGLLFSFNMFVLANIDNVNTLFFAPGIASIYYFASMNKKIGNQYKNIALFSVLIFIQVTCSIYNAIYVLVFISVLFLVNLKQAKSFFKPPNIRVILSFLPIALLISLYLYFIVFYSNKKEHWSFNTDLESIKTFSLQLQNFTSVLPYTLHAHKSTSTLLDLKSLFGGYLLLLLLLIGFRPFWQHSKHLLLVIVLALLIGIGPYIEIGEHIILMPLGWLFSFLETYSYFRFPYRIYFLILVVLMIILSQGLTRIEQKLPKSNLVIFVIALLLIFENVPLKREYLNFSNYQKEGAYLNMLLEKEPMSNILFLPAGDLVNRNGDPTIMNRTLYVFMYWQTQIKKNSINGWSCFNPPHMLELNKAIYNSENPYTSLVAYCQKYEVSYVVHYDNEFWDFDDFPLDKDKIEKILKQNQIEYILR